MSGLREKIAATIREAASLQDEYVDGADGGRVILDGAFDLLAIADAILDLPEIKEALETAANLRANQERQARLRGGGSMVWSASHARIEPKP
jgi:hypothetical protein